MMGRDRDRGRGMDSGPDKTDSDWRARPSGDQDDGPRKDDAFGDRKLNILHPNSISCLNQR